jgi:dATP pyrophosphohydrolase
MEIKSNLVEVHVFREGRNGLEFLLLKRSDKDIYPGLWQMISGHVKKKDTAIETVVRELKEETSLNPFRLWVAPNVNSFYSQDKDYISLVPVFAVQVKKDSTVKISDEHTEFKWVNMNEAKNLLAWEGQRKSVDLIVQYFTEEMKYFQLLKIKLD